MRRCLFLLLAACAAPPRPPAAAPRDEAPPDLARFVDPLIGSKGGETWPGADTPFGMLQWSPENTKGNPVRTARPGGYGHDFTRIRGFSLTHMSGTGCAGAYGDIPFYPHVGEVSVSPSNDDGDRIYASDFTHADERAEPGYYQVGLASGARVELAVTARTGRGRFTWPAGQPATLLVRTSSSEVGSERAEASVDVDRRTIRGSVTSGNFCGYLDAEGRRSYYTLYFVAVADRPFVSTGAWQDATVTPGATSAAGGTGYGEAGWPPLGKGSGVWVGFAPDGQAVGLRVGISFVSLANAEANLAAESPPEATLEQARAAARQAWNAALARVLVDGGDDEGKTVFYTALYHALLHPNVFSDDNGEYVGMDQKVHRAAPGHPQYANFSGWDVYRGQLQLVALLFPDVGSDIAASLLRQAEQNGGVWDRWTHGPGGTHVMTGDPGHIAVAGLYAFGARGFDARRALTSMVRAARVPTPEDGEQRGAPVMAVGERPSLEDVLRLHYVPADGNSWGGAGETLEDASADFAIAQLAARLGEPELAREFLVRSAWWKNVWNPAVGYIADRMADGSWRQPFDPAGDDGFAEGSSAQYTWMIPFDPHGLFAAMGGDASAVRRLDAFFHDGDEWTLSKAGGLHAEMDNEPSIGAAYLYLFAGVPEKTQATVRAVLDTLWGHRPDGIPGQDDLGAMSAWYVWSALGLYPNYPGRADLLLTAPLFARARVHRGAGGDLVIERRGDGPYVRGVRVDGEARAKLWLPESFATGGGHLEIEAAATPGELGRRVADRPPSFAP